MACVHTTMRTLVVVLSLVLVVEAGAVPRDANGRILRSRSAVAEFKRLTGYPHGRPGYVIDHIVPLALGGADTPANMQWQTIQAAKAKDRWELVE